MKKDKIKNMPIGVRASLAYTICSVLTQSLSFITLPLFTRLLTTEEYGQSTVYGSWSGLFSVFLTLNLAYGSFGPAMMKYEHKRSEYIASIEGIFLLLSGIFVVIYLPFRNMWNQLFELPTFLVLILVVQTLTSNSIALWSAKKRYEYKYKSVIALTLLSAILSPVFSFALVINSSDKGTARILGSAIVGIVFGMGIFILNVFRGKKLFNYDFWKYALDFNIPLLAYYISQMVFNQSDRIMISHYSGTGDAALYGVAYTLATVLNFVLNAINNSFVPWYYECIKKGEQTKIGPIANIIALIMAFLLILVVWAAPEIILILAGKNYIKAVGVVAPVAMSILLLFYAQLFINAEFYYEEKKQLVWASIGSAILNIILNALLIPKFGFVAAGYTTLFSYIVFAVSNYWSMKKVLKERNIPNNAFDIRTLILIAVGFAFICAVGVLLYEYICIRVVIAILVIGIIILQKDRIKKYMNIFIAFK